MKKKGGKMRNERVARLFLLPRERFVSLYPVLHNVQGRAVYAPMMEGAVSQPPCIRKQSFNTRSANLREKETNRNKSRALGHEAAGQAGVIEAKDRFLARRFSCKWQRDASVIFHGVCTRSRLRVACSE